jgi:hypothetical protein
MSSGLTIRESASGERYVLKTKRNGCCSILGVLVGETPQFWIYGIGKDIIRNNPHIPDVTHRARKGCYLPSGILLSGAHVDLFPRCPEDL